MTGISVQDLNSESICQYHFVGRVLPERTAVDIDGFITIEVEIPELKWTGVSEISILSAQISVIFRGPEILDIETLKNAATNLAQGLLDALGYQFGRAYVAEITSLLASQGVFTVFGVGITHIEATNSRRPCEWQRVLALAGPSPHLTRALSDLREAARATLDTGFFCQRVAESVRNHFGDKEPANWVAMRDALHLKRETLESLSKFGKLQRHGHVVSMSGVQRVSAMDLAWTIVDRFIAYLDASERELAEDTYPWL